MAMLLLLLLVVVFFAALGRSAVPGRERRPWTHWTWRDLVANVLGGIRLLDELSQRNPDTWSRTMEKLAPWHDR